MDDKICLLVIIGSGEAGNKELVAVSDGYRGSEASRTDVLLDLKQRRLQSDPKVAVGDFGKRWLNAGQKPKASGAGYIKRSTYWLSYRRQYNQK